MARTISEHEQRIINLVKPLETAKWQADYRWDRLEPGLTELGEEWGGFDLTPDFQRGHVWTLSQQQHFIENCMRGVVASNGFLIQLNCPNWNHDTIGTDLPPGFQCLDGLQRFTAVSEFVKGNVKPFGLTASELNGTQFAANKLHMKVAIHDFKTRADLLDHYLAINAGGTPHSVEEIERVRGLLSAAMRR